MYLNSSGLHLMNFFSRYHSPLGKLIYIHGFNHYHFIKHLQIFISSPDFSTKLQRQLSSCLTGTSNCLHLKLNLASNIPVNGPAFQSQGFIQLFIQLPGQTLGVVHVPSLLPSLPFLTSHRLSGISLFSACLHLPYHLQCG